MITRPVLRYHGGKWRLADWRRVDIHARAQSNRPRVESLWISPAAAAALPQAPLALEA